MCQSKICGKELKSLNIDFNCLMEIQSSAMEEVVVKVFNRILPFEIKETNPEQIEAKINQELSGKFYYLSTITHTDINRNGEKETEYIVEKFDEIDEGPSHDGPEVIDD